MMCLTVCVAMFSSSNCGVSRCHMNWDNNSASSLFAHFTQKSFGIEFHSSSSTPLRDAARQCSQMRISRFKPSFLPFGESFQLGRKLLATPLLWSQISRCSSILSTFLFLPFILNFGADILSSSFILFLQAVVTLSFSSNSADLCVVIHPNLS